MRPDAFERPLPVRQVIERDSRAAGLPSRTWLSVVLAWGLLGCAGGGKPSERIDTVPVSPLQSVRFSSGRSCSPTGWIDRIEGDLVVVVTDDEEEEVLPVGCFPEPVRAGTRVVGGRVDWPETRKVRAELDRLMRKLSGNGD